MKTGCAFVVAACLAAAAAAQPGRPSGFDATFSGGCAYKEDHLNVTIANLARLYRSGTDEDWKKLQEHLRHIVATCTEYDDVSNEPTTLAHAGDKPLLVTFFEKGTAFYVVVPQAEPYGNTLLGQQEVVPVILVDPAAHRPDIAAPENLQFLSARTADQREAQVAAFVKAAAQGLGKNLMVAEVHKAAPVTEKTDPQIWAYSVDDVVRLPFKRATVTEAGTVHLACVADPQRIHPCRSAARTRKRRRSMSTSRASTRTRRRSGGTSPPLPAPSSGRIAASIRGCR
jgi:hypothetical protein